LARRKDHSPEELKAAIHQAAEKLIHTKGLHGLTARALAKAIGYTPGTIYNFYRDMGALVTEVNYVTLKSLHEYCVQRVKSAKPGYESLKSLAYAYIDFAHMHERAWRTLFIETNRSAKPARLSAHYQKCISDLFKLLEETLQKNLDIPANEAAHAARLLWGCLHGITSLMLDGRLSLVGVRKPYETVDDLLSKYLKEYARARQ
jgi:AcrR family transcriptional regulator